MPAASAAERVRRLLTPVAVLLASALMVACLVSVPDVVAETGDLSLLEPGYVGWVGIAMVVAVAAAAAGLAAVTRIGPGPSLAAGAAGAVFGVKLGQGVGSDVQLALALAVSAVAVGGLCAGAVGLALEVPPRWGLAAVGAWSLPWLVAWPIHDWRALHLAREASPRLLTDLPVPLLLGACGILAGYSVWSLLVEPAQLQDTPGLRWVSAWCGLAGVTLVVGCVVMLLGFSPGVQTFWLRPLVLLTAVAVVAGLALVTTLIPLRGVRVGYLSVTCAALCAPSCSGALVRVADGGPSRVSLPAVVVLLAAALAGWTLGWRAPPVGGAVGLLILAAGCVAGWVMPASPWVMVAATGPLVAGASAAFASGVRTAYVGSMPLRFVAVTALSSLLLGLVGSVPLGWALAGSVPAGVADSRAAGRVLIGLTFALCVLTAAAIVTIRGPGGQAVSVRPGDPTAGRRTSSSA